MKNKLWLWFLAGWLLSLVFSPVMIMGFLKGGSKKG